MISLPPIQRKPSKTPFRKPGAVKELEQLATEVARLKHPTLPEYALAKRVFRDDTANSLTKGIVTYITLTGGWASRIGNQGTFKKSLGRYIPGTAKKGLADVMATYKGKSLHIEVKIGRDIQSEHQRQVESEVTSSGGFYYLARNFTDFLEWFVSINNLNTIR